MKRHLVWLFAKTPITPILVVVALVVMVLLVGGLFVPVYAVGDSPVQLFYGKYAVGDEIIELRTENSKTRWLGGDNYRYVGSISAVHFKYDYTNTGEQWKDIDLTWQGNQITKAPYTLSINGNQIIFTDKKTGDAVVLLIGDSKFDVKSVLKPSNSKILLTLPHGTDISIGKNKANTSISIREQSDADKLLPREKQIGFVDIDNKSKTGFAYKANSDIEVSVGASSDDCLVYWTGLTWGITHIAIAQAVGYAQAGEYKDGGGMRFLGITIPQGSVIDAARIDFVCSFAASGTTVNSRFTGEDVDDAVTFSTLADYQARRGTVVGGANDNYITTAQVDWDGIDAWSVGTTYSSPEIKTIVKEIVDRVGWVSGNDMVIFWDDHDNRSTQANWRIRNGASWDDTTYAAPKIYIDYTVAAAPTVTTQAATNVQATTATGNGNITDTGGTNATRHGFGWDIHTHVNWNDYANDIGTNGDFGVGAFTDSFTGLPTGTTIYCRAYATNPNGTGQGAEVTFLTKPAAPTNVAATDGTMTDNVTITWTLSFGAKKYQVYRDGAGISGWIDDEFVVTYTDTTADAPTITAGTATASDGTSPTHVTLSIAGESANDGTHHSYTVRAQNATGESVDSIANTGWRGVGALTYEWFRSVADADAAYGSIASEGGIIDPYNDTGIPLGIGRWYYCSENATGAANVNTNHNRGYTGTPPPPPAVTSKLWFLVAGGGILIFTVTLVSIGKKESV